MNNMYIIPANSKNGKLIFNIFRGIDLVVFLCGVGVSLLLFVAIQTTTMATTIIKILPISVCTFLVVPVPFYHKNAFSQEFLLCLVKNMAKNVAVHILFFIDIL